MDLIKDVADMLQTSAAYGDYVLGQNLFLSSYPHDPDDLTVLYEYASHPPAESDDHFIVASLQVMTRCTSYPDGLHTALRTYRLLKQVGSEKDSVTVSGTTYFKFAAKQRPYKLKTDENDRIYFVQNFNVWCRTTKEE